MFGPSPRDLEEMVNRLADNAQFKSIKITGVSSKEPIPQSKDRNLKILLILDIILNVIVVAFLLIHIIIN